jgi:hypothetical protein
MNKTTHDYLSVILAETANPVTLSRGVARNLIKESIFLKRKIMNSNKIIKRIIKAVVTGASEREGCCDDDYKLIRKLNKLIVKENPKEITRLVNVIERLAAYGVSVEDI